MRDSGSSVALCRLLEEIGDASNLAEACATLDRRLRELLPLDAMAVFLSLDGRIRPVYTSPGMLLAAGAHRPVTGEDIARQVAATRRPAFNSEIQSEPGEPAAGGRYGSVLAVPLDDGADVLGVLSLYSRGRNVFSAEDLGALLWIRKHLARVVANAIGAGAAVPPTSPLECGPDWPVVLDMLRVEIGGGCKQSTWVLLCRLEHIAAIGKRFGDAVLNRMVRAVTGGLRRTCRKQDAVARSGDNFILTLRDLEAPLVESKKITVAALVEGISLAHLGDRLVPVLAGAAHAPHEASEPEQLLALAAQRLRPVDIPAASFAENLVHLAAAIETGVRLPEDFSEPEPALVRVALQPVQIHAPLAGETQE